MPTLTDYYNSLNKITPEQQAVRDRTAQITKNIDQQNGAFSSANMLSAGYNYQTGLVGIPQGPIPAGALGTNTNLNIPGQIPTTNPTQVIAGLSLPQVTPIDVTQNGAYGKATQQVNQQGAGINAAQQRILELMGQQENKGAREAELQQQFQLQEKQKAQDAAAQAIQASQKAYLAEQIAVAGRPIGLERQGGKLDQLRRREAIDLLSKSITLDAATGDVASAQRGIDNALKLEFEPIQARIDTTKQFLQFNMDNFNRAEKQQAQALNIKLDKEKADLDYFRDIKKMAYANALKNGVDQGQLTKLANAGSAAEVMNLDLSSQLMGGGMLTSDQKEKIASNPTAKQSVARIGVINAVQSYIDKLNAYKGPSGTIDFNRLSKTEKSELETALKTTVGSAINVAQGQGAMGVEEANRILDDLMPTRWTRTSVFDARAKGTIDAQKSLLTPELDFLESTYPGAKSLDVFSKYLLGSSLNFTPDEQNEINALMVAPGNFNAANYYK